MALFFDANRVLNILDSLLSVNKKGASKYNVGCYKYYYSRYKHKSIASSCASNRKLFVSKYFNFSSQRAILLDFACLFSIIEKWWDACNLFAFY